MKIFNKFSNLTVNLIRAALQYWSLRWESLSSEEPGAGTVWAARNQELRETEASARHIGVSENPCFFCFLVVIQHISSPVLLINMFFRKFPGLIYETARLFYSYYGVSACVIRACVTPHLLCTKHRCSWHQCANRHKSKKCQAVKLRDSVVTCINPPLPSPPGWNPIVSGGASYHNYPCAESPEHYS